MPHGPEVFNVSGLQIHRTVEFPDSLRVARARSLPNLGPRLLFFSGGTAMNGVARRLKHYTHNSCHLITSFDSGGSSQVLREAFAMPAVGDLRSRLMALADETELGQPDIYRLFTYRFPKTAKAAALHADFEALLSGEHALMRAIAQPMRGLILSQLRVFSEMRPEDFRLEGASVGNLILAGGYLANDRALEPVMFLMSKMVDVRGIVRATVDENLGIGAELADGRTVLGQRQLTGKEVAPITAPISRLFLTEGAAPREAGAVKLPKRNRKLIGAADLVCYPPGSLFSSVIANLLPAGVGSSIARRQVPKIYLPSLGIDPECTGMGLEDQVSALLAALRADAGAETPASALMSAVICDAGQLESRTARRIEKAHGIPCIGLPLAKPDTPEQYDPTAVCEMLVSLT